jgi:PIN domain nuclease of toxin-antitoxin system
MSSTGLLLDTHIWFRYQITPAVLRPAAIKAIDEAAERGVVFVSAISVWELAMLERDGRLELDGGTGKWADEALSKPGISLLPLSPAIAVESVYLPAPMHKDPADRILVASARVERLTLVTSDKNVLNFARKSRLSHLRG